MGEAERAGESADIALVVERIGELEVVIEEALVELGQLRLLVGALSLQRGEQA